MSDFPEYDAVFLKGLERHLQPLELLLESARRVIEATTAPITSGSNRNDDGIVTVTFDGGGGLPEGTSVVMRGRADLDARIIPSTSIKHRSRRGDLLTLEVESPISRSISMGDESPTAIARRFVSTFDGAVRICRSTHRAAEDGRDMKEILKGAALAAVLDRPDLRPHIGISATARMPEFAGTIMIPMPNAISEVIDMHNRSPTAAILDTTGSVEAIGAGHSIHAKLERCSLFVDPDEIGEVEMLRLVGRFLSWKDAR